MNLHTAEIYSLIETNFNGNAACFYRELGIAYTTGWRALNHRSAATLKFIPALSQYCKKEHLNLSQYVDI